VKYIKKSHEPSEFSEWKAQKNENWEPSYGILGGVEKQALKQSLMKEQGFLCCYCENRIDENDSHIEHIRPQKAFPEYSLEYENLLCSCGNKNKKGEPLHCGIKKDDWFDKDLLVSPLKEDCVQYFKFLPDGSIRAANEERAADMTIEKLGLDIPKLRAFRRSVIAPFLDPSLTQEEFKKFVASYLTSDEEGVFSPFHMTIQQMFSS